MINRINTFPHGGPAAGGGNKKYKNVKSDLGVECGPPLKPGWEFHNSMQLSN